LIQALLAGASPFWAGIGSSWPIPGWAGAPPSRLGRRHSCSLGWASAKISRLGWLPQSRLGRYLLRPGLVRALPPGRVKQAAPASSAPFRRAALSWPPRPRPPFRWAALEQAAPASSSFPLGREGAGLAGFGCSGSPFLRYESDSIFLLVIRLVWHKKDQLAVSNLAFIILLNS
jgi:hypothetical protein